MMDGGVILRPETGEDRDFLYQLYASTRAREMELVDWSDEQKAAFLQQQFNAQTCHYQQHYPDARFDIIESAGQRAGRLYVDRGEKEIRIIDIALLPGYQRKGIGTALLQALLDEAAAEGKSVGIHVEHNNPALSLYERMGFRHVRDLGVYYFMLWSRADQS